MSKKISLLLMAVFMAMIMLLTGCAGEPDTASVENNTKKVLRVGTTTDFAPFEIVDKELKDYEGFDIELIRAIGDELGYDVEIQNLAFDGLIPALNAGNIDVIISGMSVSQTRQERILFSDPYFESGLSIVVDESNNDITKLEDLVGKRVAVQIGTTSAEIVKKMDGVEVREFNHSGDAFMELKAKGVEAVVNDRPVNDYYINSTKAENVKIVDGMVKTEDYAIAMDKKQTELCAKINGALKTLRDNGKYQEIYDKWFPAKK